MSEATICRCVYCVEDTLIKASQFHLPGKKTLLQNALNRVVMDVTETMIERPKHRAKQFYSGKKKPHTLKCQLIMNGETGEIICTYFGQGRQHDFKVFQTSGIHFHPDTKSLVDKGYQALRVCITTVSYPASSRAVVH